MRRMTELLAPEDIVLIKDGDGNPFVNNLSSCCSV